MKGGVFVEKKKIKKERSLSVVKLNDIVQKARYKLDLVQQKTIMYLISKIDSMKDVEFQDITVEIKDLCEIMGIKYNGKNVKDLKSALQKLSDKSMWVELGDKDDTITLMRWLDRVSIKRGRGTVTVRFDELMAPYLLKIQERFVQYKLVNVLPMKSQYSLRLYELIKSHEDQGRWDVELDDLKRLLFLEPNTYERYDVFRLRILDAAIIEICNFTDLMVSFTPKRSNRKIVALTFEMCAPDSYTEYSRRQINQDTVLDNLPADVASPKKLPTVKEIRIIREKQKAAKELAELDKKYNRAKKPIDYSEEVSFMPSQTTIEDLL
jgi:plasmid replication initiation protein